MLEKILQNISIEIADFQEGLKKSLLTSVPGYENILEYIFEVKGKQIRPIVGILAAMMLGRFSKEQNVFLQAVELVHNATLFHDDVIDDSQTRRNMPSLNAKFANKVAILTGDYFLSTAIKNIYSLKNNRINELFSEYMRKICEGEIEQNLTLNQVLPLEKYIQKTQNKTALLFSLTTFGVCVLAENKVLENDFLAFGENLGMLFQIKDDLKNFEEFENKPVLNDLKSGVITAPVIFLAEQYKEVQTLLDAQNYEKIISLLKNSDAFEKTKSLINVYYENAFRIAEKFPQNRYKDLLLELLAELGK